MWVLESSGNDLKGKKLWLRPGKRVSFGRTKNDEIGEHIILSHKTISRKHLTVEVGLPRADDCCNIQARSKVTIKDFNTKIGTLLNDEQVRGRSVELEKERNILVLGRYEQSYRINWIPVTLTFSFTAKEQRANPYHKLYQEFGPLDIKILVDYQHEHTTHVVTRKRNTSKSLQALIDGKHIVHNDSFVFALLASTLSKESNLAPLEVDFDGNFPNPIQYLPPKGDESTHCDEISYAPTKSRQHVFSDYSFVFYEERQYDNLMPPITAGCGKAILNIARPHETTAEDFVNFCENKLGGEGICNSVSSYEKGGIIVVNYNPGKGTDSDWYTEFCKNVALQLNLQPVEQNEFLDAILANDASILKRPLGIEKVGHTIFPAYPTTINTSLPVLTSSVVKETRPSSTLHQTRTRRTTRLKFTGFDDEFTESHKKPPNHIHKIHTEILGSTSPKTEICQSQDLFVSQDTNRISEDPEIQEHALFGQETIEKQVNSTNEKFAVELEPKCHIMKRKRLSEDIKFIEGPSINSKINSDTNVNHTLFEFSKPTLYKSAPKKKRKDIVMDVEEILQQKIEKSKVDLKNKADLESLHEKLDELDFDDVRNKIQMEEIKPRNPIRNHRTDRAEDSCRWNDLWNGRKNFKKFRRPGFGKRASEKVIVQLKEVKNRDYGIFEDYWDTDGDDGISNRGKIMERTVQDITLNKQSPPSHNSLSETIEIYPVLNTSTEKDHSLQPPDKSKLSSLKNDLQRPKETYRMRQSHISFYMSKDDQCSSSNSIKRVANSATYGPISAKKPRLAPINLQEESDEESADELKFRFKRN